MNPHFIFNSLNSIQSYILSNDAEKAVLYLGKFSQLMRLILTNSAYKFISLKEELKSITYYLDLEKLRFENKFDYTITVDKSLDEEFIEIPPMIIQPYIENAIIHGLLHKPTKGKIDIDFRPDGQRIICTVVDDGVGRQRSMEIAKQSGIKRKSRGMLITQARLEILNRQSDDEFSVKVFDLKDEKGNPAGTKVELIIYNKEEQN
jgi:sensor histidine kinase YesM